MSRAFTWWRRFYAPIKLPKQYYFKGLSPLLQRIEAGDFEFNHLHLECKLEESVYEAELNEVKNTINFNRCSEETQQDMLNYVRKKYNKRREKIMSHHLSEELSCLSELAKALFEEFEIELDEVNNVMDSFEGTTRQLYFYFAFKNKGEEFSFEKADAIRRYFVEIPKHILKPENSKYQKYWDKIMSKYNYEKQQIGYSRVI
jgi:vacuolar-type H+-ATPase subunit H